MRYNLRDMMKMLLLVKFLQRGIYKDMKESESEQQVNTLILMGTNQEFGFLVKSIYRNGLNGSQIILEKLLSG